MTDITIDELIEQVRDLIRYDGRVVYDLPLYNKFHKEVTSYVIANHLDNTSDWEMIQRNLIWKSIQYLNNKEADIILTGLENLRLIILARQNGYKETFWEFIHPSIIKVSQKKFIEENLADSIESAFKEINMRVQKIYFKISGEHKDGADLMHTAFSPKSGLFIKLPDSKYQYEKGNQEAYMELFAGAYRTSRNPFAHANLTPERDYTIRLLMIASQLMYKVDEAIKFMDICEDKN